MSKLHFRRSREALFEAALIVFAVLVALGVDKIMEQREELQLAQAALEHVATEIRHNRDELLQARESNQALLNDLGDAVDRYAAGEPLGITGVNYEVALTRGKPHA